MRFRVLGRSNDMLHVRGVNVFPGVGYVLAHLTDRFSGEFLILVDHPPPHQSLRIRVELIQGLLPEHGRLSFRAEVELVPYGSLLHTEQKAHRVLKTYA